MRSITLWFITALIPTVFITLAAQSAWMKVSAEDFVRKASLNNLFEIESGKLAKDRAQNQDVKNYATQMIDDHKKITDELKSAVQNAGLNPTLVATQLDDKHQKKVNRLQDKTGKAFDDDYMDMQKDVHDDLVNLFEKYAEDGDNPHLKSFAARTLPVLKQHEELAKQLEKR